MPTIPDVLDAAIHHYQAGRLPEAESLCRQILQVQPSHPDALHILGLIAHRVGRNDVAVELIGKAIAVNPTVAEYHNNIGEAYRALGRPEEAVACYRRALTLMPAYAEACNNLGAALHSQGKLEEATAHYRQALALKPEYEQPYVNLGRAQSEQGKVEEAVASYQRALAVRPNDGVRVLMATALPVIADSRDHLIEARRRFLEQVSGLARENLSIGDPAKEIGTTNFYLAYQGLDDREIQQAVSRLYERACPSLKYIAAHCQTTVAPSPDRKIKVGFISRMIGNHTVTAVLMRGLIAQLSRRVFSVSVFSFPHARNSNCENVSSCADRVVFLPPMLDGARRQIAHEQLDILCYVDIGMDSLTYFLAFSRLAPIQCATWQHPVTTGIQTVDYFISSQVLEPEDADAHYSEKLVRLTHLPTFYYPPAMPAPVKSRKELGLDEEKTLYLCPQSLFKLHPDFDELIGGILDADQRGEVVLLDASQENFRELLLRRFRRTIPAVVNRIRVLPRLTSQDFVHLLAVADVMLDPLYWSGGVTTLDALALGTPVVTLPGDFMRGRVTYACYTQMGVMDCVAATKEQYVGLAVRLGTDPAYRALIKSKILAAHHVLYENADAVRDLERFFVEAVETARCAADERQHQIGAMVAEALPLALQHHQAGRLPEAETLYRQVLQVQPDHPDTWNNLGNTLRAQGRLDEAVGHYRQALALRPDFAEAHNNVGVTLQDQGKLDEAITHLRQAVAVRPALAGAHSNLGRALEARGLLEDAVACYRQALALQPTLAETHNNLGNILRALGRLAESEVHYRQALSLKPEYTNAHSNLAVTLRDQGRFQESADSYRRAMALEPSIASIHSNLIFDMAYYTDTPRAITQELRKWEKQYARPLAASRPTHNNDRNADRRLRVGYVSADFHGHAVGFFIQPLLAAHDRAQVEIFGYANGDGAAQTIAHLRGLADVWRNIAGMTDEAVAQLIASDRIDILIDLSGHTSNNRLLVFARKPAPIQMTYLGSVTSSGMPAMDYRLLDRLLAPPGSAEWCSETVIRLPGYFACYRPPADAPPVGPLPAAAAGHVTFGSFNNLAKVTPEVIALWARILRRLPKARLMLKDRTLVDQAQRDRYWGLLKGHGIAAERVELLPRTTWGEYLAAYGRVDIALDPFPYNGGATTCEALWMGVPVVTLAGVMAYGRFGVSLLSNLGLPHLIATTPASYVTIAVELAKKRKPLAALRAELRPQMAASVLCDAKGFAQGVEQAYRRVWKRWCRSRQ